MRTWGALAVYLGAAAVLRSASERGYAGQAIVGLVVVLGLGAGVGYWRRGRPVGAAAGVVAKLTASADQVGPADGPPPVVELSYPPASRSMAIVLFWLGGAMGAGLLWPVATGQATDAGSAGLLIVVGAFFMLGALGWHDTALWAGTTLRVDETGVSEHRGGKTRRAIAWPELVRIRYLKGTVRMEFEGAGPADRILVYHRFPHLARLTDAALAQLRHREAIPRE